MTARRVSALATLLVAGGLAAGCASAAGSPAAPAAVEEPAVLQEGTNGGPGIVTLSAEAERHLGIRTTPVAAAGGALVMPYGAVVYEPDGSSWAFVQIRDRSFQREPVTITGVTGDQVTLSSGPPAGTLVVTQGASELIGVETGIDGEE
jgi:hypothetical protein